VGIRPGVVLEYHTLTTVKPLAAGEFWYEYSFAENYAVMDSTLQIDLPKAREIKLKSPDHKFETRDEGERLLVRRSASCDGQACKFEIEPLSSMRQNPHSEVAAAPK